MTDRILICYGTRPEYLKVLPLIRKFKKKNYKLLYVQQHQQLLKNNKFDYKLKINSENKNRLNSIFEHIFKKFNFSRFKYVLVQGDTASALGCAIAAFNFNIKIIHLEAGLRTYDKNNPYPEETYRQLISRIADIHLCPTQLSKNNLIKENIRKNVFVVGNTALDNLVKFKKKTTYSNTVLITLHRREKLSEMKQWFIALNKIAKKNSSLKFIFPLHANPQIQKLKKFLSNIKVTSFLTHEKMLKLMVKSKFLITDSGGVQEEGSFLNKKVIVCRKFTERPEGIKTGHLILCKKPQNIDKIVRKLNKNYYINRSCPYGNGKTADKILRLYNEKKI
jgi:UDP-N-acetylglucosamine 2-epimerase (non-hydrolysing)